MYGHVFNYSLFNAFMARYTELLEMLVIGINYKGVRDSMISYGKKNLVMPGDNIYDISLDYEMYGLHGVEKGFKFLAWSLLAITI